jgi:cytochrome c oxidase subunit 1
MAYTMMGIAGIGAVISVLAGGAYLLITVGSLVFGKKLDESAGLLQSFGVPMSSSSYNAQPEMLPMAKPVEEHGSAGFEAPGTFVLAMVLLVSFVVYYFINWKYLSSVWPLS